MYKYVRAKSTIFFHRLTAAWCCVFSQAVVRILQRLVSTFLTFSKPLKVKLRRGRSDFL